VGCCGAQAALHREEGWIVRPAFQRGAHLQFSRRHLIMPCRMHNSCAFLLFFIPHCWHHVADQPVDLRCCFCPQVKCHACVGGTSVREDARILSAGVHVVVGTPGRVYDMLRRRCLRAGEGVVSGGGCSVCLCGTGRGSSLSCVFFRPVTQAACGFVVLKHVLLLCSTYVSAAAAAGCRQHQDVHPG
jgi:hypothetical protein